MALNLSRADRARLEHDMMQAEPYEYDAPEMLTLDGNSGDSKRVMATIAKKLLEQDDREKRNAQNN